MKAWIVAVVCSVALNHNLFGQDEIRFRNFHGIRQGELEFYEGEAYDIFVEPVAYGLDDDGLAKIRKKYSVKESATSVEEGIHHDHIVLTKDETSDGVTVHFVYYLLHNTNGTTVIGFIRPIVRDRGLEVLFVNSFLARKIPSSVYSVHQIDSIDFVGRFIKLGPACHWMSPHNVQCPHLGQMNWAIFDDRETAEDFRTTHYKMVLAKPNTTVTGEDRVRVKFEGEIVEAMRSTVKVKLPTFLIGGSNKLVVYHLTGEVRGKFVTCVLSYYTDDFKSTHLPPLIAEVMTLPLPDGTWPEPGTSVAEPDPDAGLTEYEKRDLQMTFKIEVGTLLPVGNLSNSIGMSPSLGFWFGMPLSRKHRFTRIDAGFTLFMPQDPQPFTYHLNDSSFVTQAEHVSSMIGLQVTRTKPLKGWLNYIDFSGGLGVSFIQTSTAIPKSDPGDNTGYYALNSGYFSLGITGRKIVFKKKSIGLMIRYTYAPPQLFNDHAATDFGGASVTTALQFKF